MLFNKKFSKIIELACDKDFKFKVNLNKIFNKLNAIQKYKVEHLQVFNDNDLSFNSIDSVYFNNIQYIIPFLGFSLSVTDNDIYSLEVVGLFNEWIDLLEDWESVEKFEKVLDNDLDGLKLMKYQIIALDMIKFDEPDLNFGLYVIRLKNQFYLYYVRFVGQTREFSCCTPISKEKLYELADLSTISKTKCNISQNNGLSSD